MSTRSMVARKTENNGFIGRFVHWDGYPSGVGLSLMQAVEYFGFDKAVSVLLDEHTAGWSTIAGADWSEEIGNVDINNRTNDYYENPRGAECHCHGNHISRDEDGNVLDSMLDHNSDWGCEFAYVFDEDEKTMTVYDKRGSADGTRMIGMFGLPSGGNWYPLTRVNFNNPNKNPMHLVDQAKSLVKCCEVANYEEQPDGTVTV